MESLKVKYKIGDVVDVQDLQEVVKGITKKAINVIATNGDKIAIELQEGKYRDLLEDLTQEVATQLILSDYIITKECFTIVRKYIYNKNRDIIELIINENETENGNNFTSIQDKKAYIQYINNYQETEKTKTFNINILMEGLTERQREILNIYSKTNSMSKTAELLGISKRYN